jgi:hypothetical protein
MTQSIDTMPNTAKPAQKARARPRLPIRRKIAACATSPIGAKVIRANTPRPKDSPWVKRARPAVRFAAVTATAIINQPTLGRGRFMASFP